MAITRSKQNWEVGSKVKVGFMQLTVKQLIPTPGDGFPDVYLLESANGTQYEFQPHLGLQRVYA